MKYTKQELEETLQIITSVIDRCERAEAKFAEGTSQHTLLKNRIKALYISKYLIKGKNDENKYTNEEMAEALRPVSSIISKCEKAKLKSPAGSTHHTRFNKIINAMVISRSLITEEIGKKG